MKLQWINIYAISGDQWDNGTEIRLGRVPKDQILDREKWKFAIAGHENVSWTKDIYNAKPILAIDRHVVRLIWSIFHLSKNTFFPHGHCTLILMQMMVVN